MNTKLDIFSCREKIVKKLSNSPLEEWERKPPPILAHPRYPPSH